MHHISRMSRIGAALLFASLGPGLRAAEPAAGPPRPAVAQARLETLAPPSFPQSAQQIGASARITVRIFIDAAGRPYKTAIERREPAHLRLFDDEARSAAMRSSFHPAQDGQGQPVPDTLLLPINFVPGQTLPARCQLTAPADYPTEAREQGMTGHLWAAVPVTADGQPDASRIAILDRRPVHNTSLFDASAKAAIAQAACQPALREGQAIESWGFIQVDYTLGDPVSQRLRRLGQDGLDRMGVKLKLEKPRFPPLALQLGMEGRVVVRTVFDARSGRAVRTRILQRTPDYFNLFDEPVRRSAMQARIDPAPDPNRLEPGVAETGLFMIDIPIRFGVSASQRQPTCALEQPPPYPARAKALGKEARLVVMATADLAGRPQPDSLRVIHRQPEDAADEFDASALAAALQARCRGGQLDRHGNRGAVVFIEVPYGLAPAAPGAEQAPADPA